MWEDQELRTEPKGSEVNESAGCLLAYVRGELSPCPTSSYTFPWLIQVNEGAVCLLAYVRGPLSPCPTSGYTFPWLIHEHSRSSE